MKIDPTGPLRSAPLRRNAKPSGSHMGSFGDHLTVDTPTAGVKGGPAVSDVDALVALQGVGDATSGRSRAAQRGELLLERLEDIRLGLLTGAIPRDRLERLAGVLRSKREETGDARLSELLDEIELRAQVELAKLDMDV